METNRNETKNEIETLGTLGRGRKKRVSSRQEEKKEIYLYITIFIKGIERVASDDRNKTRRESQKTFPRMKESAAAVSSGLIGRAGSSYSNT